MKHWILAGALALTILSAPVYASQAYGSLNNFDVVNDTGHECHGFEVEIEDVHSKDITYTYSYNHYGTPRIEEDLSDPAHPKVHVMYESKKNADGSWSSYTAIPSGPIDPTNGHMFTNPSINFGGEHFGVGYYGAPSAVRYYWLLDDGAGNLVRGASLNILTPVFTYVAPPQVGVPAQVQAVVRVPEPVEVHVKEFGPASWVKVTTTQTHNNNKVELDDLVSDDPDDPNDHNWKNGEPDEVEVEWRLMQIEFNQDNGGANGELENAAQELPDGDEIITVRYDFYEYAGPYDPESGEARTDNVGPDGIHGVGTKTIDGVVVDFSTIEVVGDYIGAQMAGFDAAGQLGLIGNLQEGELLVPYVERTIVVNGTAPIISELTGNLPGGMTFDAIEGVLSGTPEEAGIFEFSVHSIDAAGADETQAYTLVIVGDGDVDLAPVVSIVEPFEGDVVKNTVTLKADAFDDFGVTSVVYTANDVMIAEAVTPFSADWDTTTVADGAYTLVAYAYDEAGNEGVSDAVTVTVDNRTPAITSQPPAGDAEGGLYYKYTLTATGNPVPRFNLIEGPAGMTLNRKTGYLRWKPTLDQLGPNTVTVQATNKWGADEQTWTIVAVDTTAPTRPKNLAATEVTSDSVSLTWTASTDRLGVVTYTLYEYYRNSKTDYGWRVLQSDLPSNEALVTGLAPNKLQKFRVSAQDAVGNSSALSVVYSVTTLP
ncbi:MAG: hypothetical protein GC168_15130 [Candidatus Hydrogenedens sp.]|nr:hypothetical protein [Candidatus Hydrogenedens sp.]